MAIKNKWLDEALKNLNNMPHEEFMSHFGGLIMTPSQQCKQAGLKSLAELVRITDVSEQTLINWHKNKPKLFKVVIAGAVVCRD